MGRIIVMIPVGSASGWNHHIDKIFPMIEKERFSFHWKKSRWQIFGRFLDSVSKNIGYQGIFFHTIVQFVYSKSGHHIFIGGKAAKASSSRS